MGVLIRSSFPLILTFSRREKELRLGALILLKKAAGSLSLRERAGVREIRRRFNAAHGSRQKW
jgi:hypothetical protein